MTLHFSNDEAFKQWVRETRIKGKPTKQSESVSIDDLLKNSPPTQKETPIEVPTTPEPPLTVSPEPLRRSCVNPDYDPYAPWKPTWQTWVFRIVQFIIFTPFTILGLWLTYITQSSTFLMSLFGIITLASFMASIGVHILEWNSAATGITLYSIYSARKILK